MHSRSSLRPGALPKCREARVVVTLTLRALSCGLERVRAPERKHMPERVAWPILTLVQQA